MPSKKRKYNSRFPAGRIKKIMQTDEEVGKVAQAVPIIILYWPVAVTLYCTGISDVVLVMQQYIKPMASILWLSSSDTNHQYDVITARTLELFVESLLSKAMQVTVTRNAKTLSPSHVKQCILAESRFDFLRDLVKNIPDVTAAEEREMMSGESSPNSSSRLSDTPVPQRVARQDSNSSSSSDIRVQQVAPPREAIKRGLSVEPEKVKTESIITESAMDLTKKVEEKPIVTANFYQETLITAEVQHKSVIKVNPTYASPQPSTSSFANLTPVEPLHRVDISVPKPEHPPMFYLDVRQNNTPPLKPPRTPVTPVLNIDFSKNFTKPEIKVLDTAAANMVTKSDKKLQRQNSKPVKSEIKKSDSKPLAPAVVDVDHLNSGNLQIDEDYDT